MLDVIHVFFEEDVTSVSSKEHHDAREKARNIIYREFYEKEYKIYSGTPDYSNIGEPLEKEEAKVDYSDVKPFDPKSQNIKPYVAPTEFDEDSELPFGKTLDAPLG